jgi:arylsulfatase
MEAASTLTKLTPVPAGRRSALGSLLALSLLLVGSSPAAGRPNVVLIMSDDMGWSDLGCYGGEIRTPALDRLAANGLRFSQFYNTARCCPTRASLLTGLYPHQAGMGHMTYDGLRPGYEGDLSQNALTLAEVLRTAGYATYMSGKWHVTRFDQRDASKHNWPRQRGFDRFYGTITGAGSFYDPTTLCRDNTFITPENDSLYRPDRYYYTDAITDNALLFLRDHGQEHAGQPFFLYVSYTAAHWPMHALPEDIAKYHGVYDTGYDAVRERRLQRAIELGLLKPDTPMSPPAGDWEKVQHRAWEIRCMEVYAAMVDRMDQGIGRIVDELARSDQLASTVIFFLQDNGGCAEGMGRRSNADQVASAKYQAFGPNDLQSQIWPPMQTRDGRPVRTGPEVMPGPEDTYVAYGRGWANVSNTPFREYKHWVHEGGISTPLIVHWPAGIPSGRRNAIVHTPGHLIDIMATCVDVADAGYPERMAGRAIRPLEGVSLRPLFEGRPLNRSQPLFWEHEGNRAVREGRWKLVAKGAQSAWELYDLGVDRSEMHNLAEQEPDRVEELATVWETWAQRARVIPWIWGGAYGEKPKPD